MEVELLAMVVPLEAALEMLLLLLVAIFHFHQALVAEVVDVTV